jgi:hypothetical protein
MIVPASHHKGDRLRQISPVITTGGREKMDTVQTIKAVEEKLARLGITGHAFARRAGVNPSTWTRWRTGETEPNVATWRKVVEQVSKLEGGRGKKSHAVDKRGRRRAGAVPQGGRVGSSDGGTPASNAR